MLLLSCGGNDRPVPDPAPAVYYWRTTFSLDSTERSFLKQFDVGKVYIRFFDVVPDGNGGVKPNATLAFSDSVPPGLEVIPTVFITEDCMRCDLEGIPSMLVQRVAKMCSAHHVKSVKELQIDCDWTETSREAYFSFLEQVRPSLDSLGWRLSATIRLHQLSMSAPPVDYGVLMVYNTGDFRDHDCANPILTEEDVAPYLRHLSGYDLPLCAAYPNFGWNLLFQGTEFKAILYGDDMTDSTVYSRIDDTRHLVVQSRYQYQSLGGTAVHLNAGDSVLTRLPSSSTILAVHDALSLRRPSINRQVIIYCLDKNNINNYTAKHYEKVFHP